MSDHQLSSSSSGFFAKGEKYIKGHKGDITFAFGLLMIGVGLTLIFATGDPSLAMVMAGLLLVVFSAIPLCGKAYFAEEDISYSPY